MKRSLSLIEPMNDQTEMLQKKLDLREKKSMTCIEDLSNELFYDIFDYLDGCDIFDAFSNLNTRFEEFLHHPSFLVKIYRFATREQTFKRYCKQIIIPNKHRIISIHLFDQVLINSFCSLCTINLSYNHLKSLVLYGIKSNQLTALLMSVRSLFQLISLNIHLIGDYGNLAYIYRLIFHLPTLKSLKFSMAIEKQLNSLSAATPQKKLSTIEDLNIDYHCSFHQLTRLLSYTPNIRRLTCPNLYNWLITYPLRLHNFESISIKDCDFRFSQLKDFIKQIGSKLKVLRIANLSNDVTYLDADRWEHLITRYLPDLRIFNFQYSERLTFPHSFTSCHTRIHRFTTAFWMRHQWTFQLDINSHRMIYSIHSYRKQWCDLVDVIPHSATQLSVVQLSGKNNHMILDQIEQISSWIQITRLHVDCSKASLMFLFELIYLLPNVDSLKIIPIAVSTIHNLEFSPETRDNQITKMHIGLITDIVQVKLFLDFFPNLEYLEMNCANDIDLKLLLESIIDRINPQLRLLCFSIGHINEQILEKLAETMIGTYCYHDFMIKHVCDRIYLRLK